MPVIWHMVVAQVNDSFFVFFFKIILLANCLQPQDPEIYHNHVGMEGGSGESAAQPTHLFQPCETMLTWAWNSDLENVWNKKCMLF